MSSSGNNMLSQWRLLAQLRNYLAKFNSSVTTQNLHDDLATLLKHNKSASNKIFKMELEKDVSVPKSNEPKLMRDKYNEDTSSSSEESKSNYEEVIKALTSLNAYIPQLPSVLSRKSSEIPPSEPKKQVAPPKWMLKKREPISRASIDARTRHLVNGLDPVLSSSVSMRRIEDLCSHLKKYPDTKGVAIKCSGVSRLLNIMHSTKDAPTIGSAREALALIGYSEPVKGHGIRILSLDGGGTRGLLTLRMLRHLEAKTEVPIHKLFDFVCGVSTGAIIAVLIGAHRLPLAECEKLYRDISNQIFAQTTFKGTASLVWKNSFYDSNAWTQILQKHMGDIPMIETSRLHDANKICLVSTQANYNWVKGFLFRNYNFPHRMASHFNGCSSARLWEGVRASAAAPGYFSEFVLDDLILLDGGVMVNNPTAIAIHEARKLWPETPLQTVVSIGTGRHDPLAVEGDKSINWASRLRTIINSATDTEGVHTTLHDLLPGNVYFRFNPHLSEMIYLDEIREDKMSCIIEDTALYMRKNEAKFEDAVSSLKTPKNLVDKCADFVLLKRQLWDL